MKMTRAWALALIAFGFAFTAFADDSQILSDIHHANQAEIDLARLAPSRSVDQDVLGYARRLISDHSQADKKTLDLARQEGIQIKSLPKTAAENTDQGRLTNLEGPAFDKEFNRVMMEDHSKVIGQLNSAEMSAQDPKIKSLISDLLPTLHNHYDMASRNENVEAKGGAG